MALEIERKFLVHTDSYKAEATGSTRIAQGYIGTVPGRTVRVRIRGDKGYLTIKGNSSADGLVRYEWEKEIPVDEARELLQLCEPGIVDKTRSLVPVDGHVFEVDEFYGDNEGLVMAEVELSSPEEEFTRPSWLGEEVTGDVRYYNKYLSKKPFKTW
ncbi:MAG: CYTH domain-containing protein [Bacteroidales bacterium]|nr:CYTH domain-containing protein [Candidatus Cryptobacteroides caccocaballi]